MQTKIDTIQKQDQLSLRGIEAAAAGDEAADGPGAALSYWRQALAGAPACLELPTDRPRPAVQSRHLADLPFEISAGLAARLRAVAEAADGDLETALLSGFAALLGRYANQEDVVIGLPAGGLPAGGPAAAIRPVAVNLSGGPDFARLLGRVAASDRAGRGQALPPFEALAEALAPQHDPSHNPLLQAMFIFRDTSAADAPLPALVEQVDITLALEGLAEGSLAGRLHYNTDLFDGSTAARMASHLRRLLEGAAARPQADITTLELLSAEERSRQLFEWNDTAEALPPCDGIQQLFEAQAARTPQAACLTFNGETLSYAEVEARANQLAHHLKSLGIGREKIVGLCLERSFEMLIGILGVLKAGGAYLPLEPGYPADRLEVMIQDAGPGVILTLGRLAGRLPDYQGAVVCLDSGWPEIASHDTAALPCQTAPDTLAYVIYTSGSTGKPKGVMNEHGGVANRLQWMMKHFSMTRADSVLAKTPFSFDVSVWEMLWPIIAGGRLVIVPPGGHRDPACLSRLIAEEGITKAHFVPSMLSAFLDAPGLEHCGSLKHVFCSGEALPKELEQRFFRAFDAELHNLYGPTEAAIEVSYWRCLRDDERPSVPLGYPISNVALHVLDKHLEPCPVGVAGELFIGGVAVARGYLNRPELTADRFIADPYGRDPQARLYRTGDLARFREDGLIEYLGRIDSQVKIRGYRIELGEIENVLMREEAVREAVVVVRPDATGEPSMVAYVVPEVRGGVAARDLVEAISRSLPDFMVPSAFVFMEAFPTNANGKLDRKALPAPETKIERGASARTEAATATEREVLGFFTELLGSDDIGAGDSFFDLGGHSLLATRLMARIRRGFGVEVSIPEIFNGATVREIGAVIDAKRGGAQPATLSPAVLDAGERQRVLVEWNATEVDFPRDAGVHEVFSARAAQWPDAVAVADGGQRVTYAELEARANRLAHHLRGLGVGPEVVVGLCVERGVEMIVSVLAILKAGGAYLPLDPNYPVERLRYMLADAGAAVLITQAAAGAALEAALGESLETAMAAAGTALVRLDAQEHEIAACPDCAPDSVSGPESLAYVMYTSGSTGKPKGVMVEHRNILRLVTEPTYVALSPDDTFLLISPLAFDASTFEIWCPLINGATLAIYPADRPVTDFDALAACIAAQRVSIMFITIGLFQQLVAQRPEVFDSLRQVLTGGDVVQPQFVEAVLRRASGCAVSNAYGPTECTTFAAHFPVAPDDIARGALPIGRPIGNTQLYVLDAGLEPAAVGVEGELYIGGEGVARGYLGRPELTAERFIDNPFRPGERIYRTGDLARWRADGNVEFLGRADQQVKIRGHRIELGEVESVLAAHGGVAQAIAMAREDVPGDKRLVAYVVAAEGAAEEAGALRAYLKKRLPAYMIPSAIVAVPALPLTANGKVDRKALPAPHSRADLGDAYVAPQSDVEQRLAEIWAEVLRIDRVGVDDNFFDLGGDSLLVTRLAARLRQELRIQVSVPEIFDAATLRSLAALIEPRCAGGGHLLDSVTAEEDGATRHAVSRSQSRMWFLQELGQTTAYNIPLLWRIEGRLDGAALQQALAVIEYRHEVLRSRFLKDDGKVCAEILPVGCMKLEVVELSGMPAADREAAARRFAQEEAGRPFDLSEGAAWRATLLRLGEADQMLAVTFHHIIFDGWSLAVFCRELEILYKAFALRAPSPLPRLSLRYADYAAWQQRFLAGAEAESQLGYWRRALDGVPACLELPTDRPRPAVQTQRGARVPLSLSADLVARLTDCAKTSKVTLFMTVLAAYASLLGRYANQEDVVIGVPVASRTRAELEPLLGCFINTLPLRVDLSGRPDFRSLLGRVRRSALDGYAHQEIPFDRLVEALCPQRDPSYNPLMQAMLVMHDAPVGQLDLPGVSVTRQGIDTGTAKLDVNVILEPAAGGGLAGRLEYNADLFEAATMERMAAHLLRLLEGAAADPDAVADSLPLLSAAESRRQLVEWNDTAEAFQDCDAIHQLFEARASESPEAPALTFEGRTLSYAEVEARANQLARHLQTLGVGPERIVALCVERGPEMVIGILGVLKAGGAYLPLDAGYPRERLEAMIEDAKPLAVLTLERLAAQLPQTSAAVVRLDADWAAIAARDAAALPCQCSAENLAYVIYTSGSTGKPKGVMIEHRQLINYTQAVIEKFGLAGNRSFALLQPVAVDMGHTALFPALCCGAELHLLAEADILDGALFARYLAEHDIDCYKVVPSHLNALLTRAAIGDLLPRRTLILGGEAAPRDLLDAILEKLDGRRLFNHYGPTETTVGALVTDIAALEDSARGKSVGRPLANVAAFVLDANLQPVPPGVAGELCIAGAGVARGYLNNPGLTAERFITFEVPGAGSLRVYRTGDRARQRADGEILLQGRIDRQVKIGGHRIEPGEIEAVLRAAEGVEAAAVMVDSTTAPAARLVAFVAGETCEPEALRAFCQQRLPHHMVPANVVVVDAMPLLSSGKTDYRALAARLPDSTAPSLDLAVFETETQRQVAEILAQSLAAASLGPWDNFFHCGGHSLAAIAAAHRLGSHFGVDLPVRAIFERPTAAELAELIEASAPAAESEAVFNLVPVADKAAQHEAFPLTDLQYAYLIGDTAGFQLGFRAQRYSEYEVADLDVARYRAAWDCMVARHTALRTVFYASGEQQVLANPPALYIPLHDLRGKTAEEQEAELESIRAAMQQPKRACDSFPLFDIAVSRLGETAFRLHHRFDLIACDSRSTDVIFQELEIAYRGEADSLPDVGLSFRDYVIWRQQLEQSAGYRRSLRYWQERTASLPPAPQLPVVDSALERQDLAFSRMMHSFDAARWAPLKALAQRHRTTPAAVLCTAFAGILANWSRHPHFTLNCLFSDRQGTKSHFADTIGCFSSTILLEVDQRPDSDFAGHVARLQSQLLSDLEHAAVGGVAVLRDWNATLDAAERQIMPVVFSTTLGTTPPQIGEVRLHQAPCYRSLQTPQVYLDHQAYEDHAGNLVLNWDVVRGAFHPGVPEAMFQAYIAFVETLFDSDDLAVPLPAVLPAAETAPVEAAEAAGKAAPALMHLPVFWQALRRPSAIAVQTAGRAMTYGELAIRAQGLAEDLVARGIGAGDLVPVIMRKGIEQVVSVLAVQLAGGAYVPLDAALPEARIAELVADTGAAVCLTQPDQAGRLADLLACAVLAVDLDSAAPATAAVSPLLNHPRQKPEDLAYIIFTSGSTGKPKGVMIEHAAAVNTLEDCNERFQLTAKDAVLGISSLSFDLSVYDVFGVLAAGGKLVLPDSARAGDPGHWLDLVQDCGVTLWNSVPALMQMFADFLGESERPLPDSLRLVMMSGDWIPVSLPQQLHDMKPTLEVVSLGGATEASIWSISYPIAAVDPAWRSIPYGRAMRNQTVYVLDDGLGRRPTWATGELFIGGAGVARGYFADAEKTASKFIVHPHSGERLYRTGDLGRYLPDGEIEFLGREDHQVKLNGYRIEIGEIEAALKRHQAVRQVLVDIAAPAGSAKALVAYVVVAAQGQADETALRDFLADRLPSYMVPQHVILLDSFPLTGNGKIDRKRLPQPSVGGAAADGTEGAPVSVTELKILRVWQEMLEDDSLDVATNFFDAGGNSLLAARLLARLEKLFGTPFALSTVLSHPTVRAFAAFVEEERQDSGGGTLLPVRQGEEGPRVFYVPGVGGHALNVYSLSQRMAPGSALFALQPPGLDGDRAPAADVPALAAHFIQQADLSDPRPLVLMGHSFGGWVVFEMALQLQAAGQRVDGIVLLDSRAPTDAALSSRSSKYDDVAKAFADVYGHDAVARLMEGDLDEGGEASRRLYGLLAERGVLPEGLPETFAARSIRVLISHLAMNYRPQARFAGRVIELRARESGLWHQGGDAAGSGQASGWAEHCAIAPEVHYVAGDHDSLLVAPQVDETAGVLNGLLEELGAPLLSMVAE